MIFKQLWRRIWIDKIKQTEIKKSGVKKSLESGWYPENSFGHEKLVLALALYRFKIELYKSLIEPVKNEDSNER